MEGDRHPLVKIYRLCEWHWVNISLRLAKQKAEEGQCDQVDEVIGRHLEA